MDAALGFVRAHWALIIAIGYAVSNLVVMLTPKRYQQTRWFGDLLWFAHWTAAHAHFDEPTSLKVPILNIPVRIGAIAPPASVPVVIEDDPRDRPTVPPRGSNGTHT